MVRRAVRRHGPELKPGTLQPEAGTESDGETLHPVDADEIAQRARGQALGRETPECARAGETVELHPQRRHVLLIDRLGHVSDRLVQRLGPGRIRVAGPNQPGDLRAGEHGVGDPEVQLVIAYFPAAPDDSPGRKVEPGDSSPDLHLLAAGEPVAVLVQGALEHHADILQLAIEICGGREAEAKPHQLRRRHVDVEIPHHQRPLEVAGTDLHLVDDDLAGGGRDGK